MTGDQKNIEISESQNDNYLNCEFLHRIDIDFIINK